MSSTADYFFDELEKLATYVSGYFRDGKLVKGHYRKKSDIPITIERPKGTVRKGRNRLGESWSRKTTHDYGFVPGTRGMDGEEVDVYVGPKKSKRVYVMHQLSPTKTSYDEDKVMLGFKDERSAREAFIENSKDPEMLGDVTTMSLEEFVRRLKRREELIDQKKKEHLRKRLAALRAANWSDASWG